MTKRISEAAVTRPDIDLRDPEILDLRDPHEDAAPTTPADPPRSALSPREVRLFDLLNDPVVRDEQLLDALVDLCERRLLPPAPADVRGATWCEMLAALVSLGERAAYVGTFRVQIDNAVAAAGRLPAVDRKVAALLVLDRTAAEATSARDFRHGVVGARAIDARVLAPRAVIDSVLRPCLAYDERSVGTSTIGLGLSITLSVLASGNGQAISGDGMWAVRAALALLPSALDGAVRTHVDKLTGQDRRILEVLIAPDRSRHFWNRRRWDRLEATLRHGSTSDLH